MPSPSSPRALGAGYVFGVEFVELGLGDAREQSWHAGEANTVGLHGAGLISAAPLWAVRRLFRLETSGRWFDGTLGERRVGGRMAMMATLPSRRHARAPGRRCTTRATPLRTTASPRPSGCSMRSTPLAPGLPVLIGGDFNTNTLDRSDRRRPLLVAAALRDDPDRLVLPMRYEPMFDELRRRGYDWEHCNVMGARTQRTRPDGTPIEPLGRIDWFFARGLACSDPAVLPAVDEQGVAISDHDALVVTVRPNSA